MILTEERRNHWTPWRHHQPTKRKLQSYALYNVFTRAHTNNKTYAYEERWCVRIPKIEIRANKNASTAKRDESYEKRRKFIYETNDVLTTSW